MITLKVEDLSAKKFKPFGQVVQMPETEPTASMEGLQFWSDLAALAGIEGTYGVGFASLTRRPFQQASAERHMNTSELLIPVDGDMVVIVGAPDHPDQPERLCDTSRFAAFRVRQGQAVVFGPGVWHWAPFPVDVPVRLFVIYRIGTAGDDAVVVDLPPEKVLTLKL